MNDIAVRATDPAPDPTGGRLVAWAQAASAAHQLAKALVGTTFVPRVKDPRSGQMVPISEGDATATIIMGDEVGLAPLAALRSIYVVHGTPAMYARTMRALVQSHGHEMWTVTASAKRVVVAGRRRGSTHVEEREWTIDRAQAAGYTANKKYATNPQEMLQAKADAEVARIIAADVLAGIPYTVEDLELGEDAAPRRVAPNGREVITLTPDSEPEPKPDGDAPEPAVVGPTAEDVAASVDPDELRVWWRDADPDLRAQIEARVTALDAYPEAGE